MEKKAIESWIKLKAKLKIGTMVYGKVFRVERFGVFVDINEVFDGIVLAPYINDKEYVASDDFPKIDDVVECIILGFAESRLIEHCYVSLKIKI